MNMQSIRPVTAAEQTFVDVFVERLGNLHGDGAIAAIRDGFMHDLREDGLPTRRIEAWHYTDLRNLLKKVPDGEGNSGVDAVSRLVEGSDVLAVVDGLARDGNVPEGVTLGFYRDSLTHGVAGQRMVLQHHDDLIGRLNGALVNDGYSLTVGSGVELSKPLEVQVIQGGGQSHSRFPVDIGKGVKATFVERHVSVGDERCLVSSITDLRVGDNADVIWIISQERGIADTHFGQINIQLGANAKLTLYVVNSGGNLVRQELNIVAKGQHSELVLRGINLLGGDSHTDVTMTLDHLEPDCVSSETFRNVVFDHAHGVFQGQIRVAQIAQKTDAKMACNTLLLSDHCDFSAKPELEIFADDVQCGHGATVTDIEEEHLFYMKSRGIGERKARALLVKAFVAELVEELEDDALIEALEARIENWLDLHG
ncbi:MAG: Fe-S cluster assembly protein SufD [Pseudomonadota bacterium]